MPESKPQPKPSDPPRPSVAESQAVKLERNRLEALIDWVALVALTYLLADDKLHGDYERGAAIIGILAIAGVSGALKALGKGGSPVMLIAGVVAKAPAALLGLGRWHTAIAFSLWVATGCAGESSSQRIADARNALNGAGAALQQLGGELGRSARATATLCEMPAITDTAECHEAVGGALDAATAYNAVVAQYGAAQDAIDLTRVP